MGSPILKVPLEVLLHITSSLTTPEYGNFRRTCKTIETCLFSSFALEFFTKRKFMFTEFSLQTLVDISKSRFSSHITHVIFGLERPQLLHTPPRSDIAHLSVQDCVNYNYTLLTASGTRPFILAGRDIELLAEAFVSLSNLKTIGVRDFNSRSRYRDFPSVQWRSYGMGTFEAAGGVFIVHHPEVLHQKHLVFLNTLIAMGKSGVCPKHYEVILRYGPLEDSAFYLPPYIKHHVQPVLANLETLFLDCNIGHQIVYTKSADGNPEDSTSFYLRTFLSELPQIQHLRLNFPLSDKGGTEELLTWLSKPVSSTSSLTDKLLELPHSPKPINFLHLRQLDIGSVSVRTASLIAVIRKFANTLRIVSFNRIYLLGVTPADEVRVNSWAKFLDRLSKLNNLNLTTISMSHLAQFTTERNNLAEVATVTFKGSKHPRFKKWTGPDMQSGLRDFQDQMVVNWPAKVTTSDENEDENTEDSVSEDEHDNDNEEQASDESDD